MPIELNYSWLLYDPAYAAAVGSAVACTATVAYLVARRWSQERVDRYKRVLGLLAEILVSVGIVGLITFAARSRIDSEIYVADTKAQDLQRDVNSALWDFARRQCLQPVAAVPPTRTMGTIHEACHWWLQLLKSPDEFVDWWGAREGFRAMASEPQAPDELRFQYAGIAQRIDRLVSAQNDHALDTHKKTLLEHQFSWPFVAACALFAIAGIALKWARAALDLRSSRRVA